MKIMYDVGDKVIIKSSVGVYNYRIGNEVEVLGVDLKAFDTGDEPYRVGDGKISEWVYDFNIEPATVSLPTEMNEEKVTEYRDRMLENENKKCLEFLANHSSEYFTPEEIYKNAKLSFISLKTLERKLIHQSELPFWKSEAFGYDVSCKLKPNKKKYYGDDGSVLFRGKSEHYFCAVKKVKEVYDYDDEEECEEDE